MGARGLVWWAVLAAGTGCGGETASDGNTAGGAGGIVGTGGGGGSGGSAGAAGAGGSTGGACSSAVPEAKAKLVATGDHHTCAIRPDGTLWCWGRSDEGALGIGPKQETTPLPAVVDVLGNDVRMVAAGRAHTCAIKTDGTLWCWGANGGGQLGSGKTGGIATQPVQVAALGSCVTDVALGANHSCARKADGTFWCWGANDAGQIGYGMTGDSNPAPMQLSALGGGVAAFTLGGYHTCAVKTDNTLWCWGDNTRGQFGDGTGVSLPSPVQVGAAGAGAMAVAAGAVHTCATKLDGTLWCWGTGSLGGGDKGICEPGKWAPPVLLQGLSDVASLSARASHGTFACDATTCAVKADGTVWCWGDVNGWGGLSPTKVGSMGANVTSVSVSMHACATTSDAAVWCWGFNGFGQLGDGTTANSDVPVKVLGLSP